MKAPAKKTARTARSSRQGILVLGMHRSGTSALTRVLNLLGCALPANLIGPGDGNVLGHWEAADAVTLNDEILASAGSSWEDWGPINEEWRQSGIRSEMLDRIGELVAQHAALGPLFALKDPRICRLADLWFEAMDAAGVEPLAVLMVRNPLEVVRSLESRDLMVPAYGQLLWLRHVLDAEFASRGRKRVVCRYDQMMRNWPGMVARIRSSLGVALPRNSPAVRAAVDAFLTSEQRHQEVDLDIALEDPWLSSWVRRTLAILVRWSEQGEDPADYPDLDEIRRQFNNAYSALAALFIDSEIVGSVGLGSRMKAQLNQEIELARRAGEEAHARAHQTEALEVELGRLQSETQRLTQEAEQLSQLSTRVSELQGLVEWERGRATGLEEQLQALDGSRHELEALLESERGRSAGLEEQLQALDGSRHELEALLESERGRSAGLEEQLQGLAGIEQELQAQVVQNAELAGRLGLAESTLLQRQEELAQLWGQMRAADEETGAARAELAQERQRRQEAEERVKVLDSRALEARVMLNAAQNDRAKAERDLKLRSEEITKLNFLLLEQEEAAKKEAEARSVIEAELSASSKENAELLARLEQRENEIRNANAAKIAVEQKLAARFDEIARLTRLLVDESDRVSRAAADAEWMQRMHQLAENFPKWWVILPRSWRRRREHARYRRAGLFDAKAYLELYPDIVEDGMDPVRHYVLHGMAEGRKRWE